MKVNLKRGLVAGLVAAALSTLLFAACWYFTLAPGIDDSTHFISRWWRGDRVSATLWLAVVVFVTTGLIAFAMGAFRPDTSHTPHDKSA
jgi:hypothetical protein